MFNRIKNLIGIIAVIGAVSVVPVITLNKTYELQDQLEEVQTSLNQIQLSIEEGNYRISKIEKNLNETDQDFTELVEDLGKDIEAYKEELDNKEQIILDFETKIENMSVSNPVSEETINEIVKSTYNFTEEEITLIAKLTIAEAGNQSDEGKRLVIDTVLNRMDSPYFPDTVEGVIFQKYQFSPVWNGGIDKYVPDEHIIDLVKEEINDRTNSEVIFFTAGKYGPYGVPLFQVEDHYFSKYE